MAAIEQEIQQTLDFLRAQGNTLKGALNPDTQKSFTTASGLQAYNLEPVVKLMVPLLTPILNKMPRINGKGKQAEYKSITGINTARLNGWTQEGNSGAKVTTAFQDNIAIYKILSLADGVTFEAEWEGQGFTDVKALAVANLIRAMKIQEEFALLFGQNNVSASNQQAPGAAGSIGAPGVAQASTGGSIASGTYYTVVVPWTGMGAGIASAQTTTVVAAGSTNQLTVTPTYVSGQPILGYDVYMGTVSGGPYYKVTTSNLAAGYVLGGSINGSAMLTNGAPVVINSNPTTGATPPTSDGTASSLAYNGIFAQGFGGSGAYTAQLNAALTSTSPIDTMLKSLWDNSKGDPDTMYCNSTESLSITDLTLGASGTPYFVTVDNQNGATAGYRVARFTNKVTGTEVLVNVHPDIPQGNIMALSNRMPSWYVPTDIPNTMAIDVVQDYTEIDYPPVYDPSGGNGDTWTIAVKFLSTFKMYLPLLQGFITGIKAS